MALEESRAMIADGVLALGIVLVVLLLILVARGKSPRLGEPPDDARAFIARQIDEHIEALAQKSLEARLGQGVCRPGTDRFAQEIELFIGDVLLRHAERAEPWLRDELREILVLQRDDVYGEIRMRVEMYLRRSSVAA
jgi:hypothetical protein